MDSNTNDYLADFPALNQRVNDERLAYLDNAATVQAATSGNSGTY